MDKNKTCYGCPDRHIGCHGTCKFYLKRKVENDRKNQIIRREKAFGCVMNKYRGQI